MHSWCSKEKQVDYTPIIIWLILIIELFAQATDKGRRPTSVCLPAI
jgi:hypothetical protein